MFCFCLWFFFPSFVWSFISFLGLHSIKLSGQESCLVPGTYLSTLTFTERFIITLSPPPLLCPMPTTAGSSTFLFDVQLHSHPSLKTSSSLPAYLSASICTLPRFTKNCLPFWDCLRTSLSNTPRNSLGDLTSWQCRKMCKAAVSRAPDNRGAQVYVGILLILSTQAGVGGCPVRDYTKQLLLLLLFPVSLYSTALELFPFSSGHRIFMSTVEGKILYQKIFVQFYCFIQGP